MKDACTLTCTLACTIALSLSLVCFAGGVALAVQDHDHDHDHDHDADHHDDGETVTKKGQFVWDRDDRDVPGDIEAVFTPAGDDKWNVVFRFEWDGEMRAWAGEARGSLKKGTLEGEATEDRGRERTFFFSGTVKKGKFSGEHGRVRDGEKRLSGTMTLE